MRPWSRWLPVALLALPLSCQRLPGDEGDDGGSSNDETTTSQGTFLPGDDDDDDADATGDPESVCDPVTQIGCPSDQRCTAIISEGDSIFICVPDTGELDPNSPCQASPGDGVDGCPSGHVCLDDEAENGLCAELCEANGDCDQGQCIEGGTSPITYCATDCSPFESLCPSPLQCRRNGNRFSCEFLGINDSGGEGSPCSLSTDAGCAPGFVCVPGALVPDCIDENCCVGLCDLSDTDPCPAPSTCNGVLTGPAPGFEDIGACFVPS